MSPVDQHGTEDQTHGRAGGVRRTQTGFGDRPVIHHRKTGQIAPGRQADAIARAREYEACWKSHGIEQRTTLVLTGTLGRLCWSWEWESMAAREAGVAKVFADPHMIAIMAKASQEARDGTSPFVPNTMHDEYWRDA